MTRLDETLQKIASPLLGISVHRFDLAVVEMSAMIGFHAVWIEMEHTEVTWREAADMCRLSSALGMLTMIRVPDSSRDHVLKAAECGPDIIDLPMGNTPEILAQLAAHARYAPEGNRGFFGASRAVRYGIGGDIAAEQRRINRDLCLMSQIETREAVDRADQLCKVPGIDAIFLGPGDLSTSLGVPGQVGHPAVVEAMNRTIATAKSHGKRVALLSLPTDVGSWAKRGVDLIFCASDTGCIKAGAQSLFGDAHRSLANFLESSP